VLPCPTSDHAIREMDSTVQISPAVHPVLSLEPLVAFLHDRRPHSYTDDLRADLIAGGRSNLTYLVTDSDGTQFVLRRPPTAHVLPTAHNMFREYTVLRALRGTDIPVPAVIEYCDDPSIIGAPFYMMEYRPGVAFRRAGELADLGAGRTLQICERMVDALVDLHAIVPAEVGLADFGHPKGFLARQVTRWKKQLDASRSRDLPGIDELYDLLVTDVPNDSKASIVHGDYRLDNLLFDEHDAITAVLDWEMATLGEPLTDVALLVAYRTLTAELNLDPDSNNAAAAPGFPTVDQMLHRYSVQSGHALPPMGFYLGLAYFKLVTIIEGVHYRDVQSRTLGVQLEDVSQRIQPLIAAGVNALKGNK
jgi:aminoglycoside phosphotransferase (APT) family kinase protein